MRERVRIGAFTLVTLVASLGLFACGGGEAERRRADSTWEPSERLPPTAAHWWWEPVERYCEENQDCRTGETCQLMRLGTCPQCPRGQDARVCVGPEEENQQANSRRRQR